MFLTDDFFPLAVVQLFNGDIDRKGEVVSFEGLRGSGAGKKEINTYNFRQKAATDMAALVEALKNSSQPVIAKTSKIKGGC